MSLLLLPLLAACAPDHAEVQISHATADEAVRAAISATDRTGGALKLTPRNTRVTVETRGSNGSWSVVDDVQVQYTSPPLLDVMLVADHSGSIGEHAEPMREAMQGFVHRLMARNHPDRLGLVRVSTAATLEQPPTSDPVALQAAVESLQMNNGWTALWDGIRLANEALEAHPLDPTDDDSLCYRSALPSIVAFTDGVDNNSAAQHSDLGDDGIDTTLDDLLHLEVTGIPTAVHAVGIGSRIDSLALAELADGTGGTFVGIRDHGQLTGALRGAAARLEHLVPICFSPPDCQHVEARITVEVEHRGQWSHAQIHLPVPRTCDG